MPDATLGEFEHLILLTILRLGGETYTVPVVETLRQTTGRKSAPAAVYITLRRLEKRGLLSSRLETDETPDRRTRPRRFFQLEEEGRRMLRETRAVLLKAWDGVEPLLERR